MNSVDTAFDLVSRGLQPVSDALQFNQSIAIANAQHQRAVSEAIDAQNRERQFVTGENAAKIAGESRLQSERIKEESAADTQRLKQAEDLKQLSDAQTTARRYSLPTKDADGDLLSVDALTRSTQDAAKNVVTKNNTLLQSLQSQVRAAASVLPPKVGEAQIQAARNLINSPETMAKLPADVQAKLKAAQVNGTLPSLVSDLTHTMFGGNKNSNWFSGDAAGANEFLQLWDAESNRVLDQMGASNALQQKLAIQPLMERMDTLQKSNAEHTQYMSAQDVSDLMAAPTPKSTTSGDPISNFRPNKLTTNASPAANSTTNLLSIPAPATPPSPLTQHFQSLAAADDAASRAQALAQRLTDLTRQKQTLISGASSSAPFNYSDSAIPMASGAGTGDIPTPSNFLSNSQRAQQSYAADALDSQIQQTQSDLQTAIAATYQHRTNAFLPPQQPTPAQSSLYDAQNHQAIISRMQQNAVAQGATPSQMSAVMQSAQSGDTNAISQIQQAYQNAKNSISGDAFQTASPQP